MGPVLTAVVGLAAAIDQADPARQLAMQYAKTDYRIYGAKLGITAAVTKRPPDGGGGYELVVSYTFDYTGRRRPFIIYPPSFDENDGHATQLSFFQRNERTGAAYEKRLQSRVQISPPSPRDGRKPFLVGTADRPASGELRVLLRNDGSDRNTNGLPVVSNKYYVPSGSVNIRLMYTPVARGQDEDAWTGGWLHSNVLYLRLPY